MQNARMPKPLESDHQRYQVQCCIADPTAHHDPRCRLGVTGRAELNLIFPQPAVWFSPDSDGPGVAFPMPLTALLFGSADIDRMPKFYRRLLPSCGSGFEVGTKDTEPKI